MRPLRRLSLVLLITLLGGSGALHLLRPDLYAPLIPAFLGDPRPVVYASGVAELLAAGLLAMPATRRAGAWSAVAVLVAVFPGNVKMALDGGIPGAGFPLGSPVAAWLRLPLQLPLIWWAWTFTRDPARTARPPHGDGADRRLAPR